MMRRQSRTAIIVSLLMTLILIPGAYSATLVGKTMCYDAYTPDWSVTAGWSDGFHYYYLWVDPAALPDPPETATCQISIAQAGLYDIYVGAYTRDDYSQDARYIVNFKPGGAYYQVENDRQINSFDNSLAASGQVKVSVNLDDPYGGSAKIRDAFFLGRYEFDAATYDLVITTDGMTDDGFVGTPWVGVAGPQAPKSTADYEDADGVIPFSWMVFDDPDQYYWGGHPKYGYMVNTQFFCFPSTDRGGTGDSRVMFTEVYGATPGDTDQPIDLPLTVYFEPGTTPVALPDTGEPMITSYDDSLVADGIMLIDVNTQSPGTVSLGTYNFDVNKTYGVKIEDWPVTETGLSNIFIRKFALSLPDLPPAGPTPTPTPTPLAAQKWNIYE